MDWGYALAGGAYAVGDAYGEEQKKQREWKREQATADAAQVRKENFARFGIEIDKQKDINRSAVKVGEHKAIAEYDQQNGPSGYVDRDTGQPVMKSEVEGYDKSRLTTPEEYARIQKNKGRDADTTEREKKIIEEYGEGSPEHKQWKAKTLGVPKDDSRGTYTQRDIIKDEAGLKEKITKTRKEYGTSFGPKAAEAISVLEAYRDAEGPVQKQFYENNQKRYRQAEAMENIAKKPELAELTPKQADKWLEDEYPDMTKKDREAIIQMAGHYGTVGEPKWMGLK